MSATTKTRRTLAQLGIAEHILPSAAGFFAGVSPRVLDGCATLEYALTQPGQVLTHRTIAWPLDWRAFFERGLIRRLSPNLQFILDLD